MQFYRHRTALFLPILLVFSCQQTTGWKTLDFSTFTIKVPANWKKIKLQGTDSYYGGLTNRKDTLFFDYGIYDVDFEREVGDFLYAKDTINGKQALIRIPESPGSGIISMYIPRVRDVTKFTIWGDHIIETDTILKMFKSVMFQGSDSSKNPPLTRAKFTNREPGNGKSIFLLNCAACHSPLRDGTGPSLQKAFDSKSAEWIFGFLSHRAGRTLDSSRRERIQHDGQECLEFKKLSLEQVKAIMDYVKSKVDAL